METSPIVVTSPYKKSQNVIINILKYTSYNNNTNSHTIGTYGTSGIAGTSGTAAQQNYLTKTDLDSSIFLCENPVFMSIQVMVVPAKRTWMAL